MGLSGRPGNNRGDFSVRRGNAPEPGDTCKVDQDDCQIDDTHFWRKGVFQHTVDLL